MTRTARAALLAAMALAWVAMFPFAVLHADLARDLLVARGMLDGAPWPLLGPVLAGGLHLGPAWYWLLGGLQAIGLGWPGTLAVIALLGATQFPLAYLAGKALHSRGAGLLWATLLLLPSWSTFEAVFPQHPTLTASAMLAAICFALRFVRRVRGRDAVACAFACTIAVHAHPSAAGLAVMGLLLAAWGSYRGALRAPHIALCALAALAPFVPLLWAQWTGRFDSIGALSDYLASPQADASLARAPALAWAAWAGGSAYWIEHLQGAGARAVLVLLALLGAAGVVGFVGALREPGFRARGLVALAVAMVLVLVVVLLRSHTPYYMVAAIRVPLLGLLAVGLATLAAVRPLRLLLQLAVSVLGFQCWVVATTAAGQARGTLSFALLPLGDVTAPALPPRPMPVLPAWALVRDARFACAHAPLVAHGAWASLGLNLYAVGPRLYCPADAVAFGGVDPTAAHWIGLPRGLWQAIGRSPAHVVGGLGMAPVRRVLGAAPPRSAATAKVYPPLAPAEGALQRVVLAVALAAEEHLAISHLGFVLAPGPQVSLRVDGALHMPLARDGISTVFHCPRGCRGSVLIESAEPQHVDVVVF